MKMTKYDLEATLARLGYKTDKVKTFWNSGEVPDSIISGPIRKQVYAKLNLTRTWLLSNGHPVDNNALKMLCVWQQQKGSKMRVPALAFKYLFLCIERDNGNEWTKALDDHADMVAKTIVKNNKIR